MFGGAGRENGLAVRLPAGSSGPFVWIKEKMMKKWLFEQVKEWFAAEQEDAWTQ